MKKILSIITIFVLSFLLVGCGCENKEDKKEENNEQNQIEETLKSFYTDDNKLVYNNGDVYKIVFYYEDDKITGLEHYYEYKDEKEAKEKYEEDKETLKNNTSIKDIILSGKYVVYVLSGDQYEGKTVQEVKDSYTYLIPVYE